jgi:hypothetical protein
VPYFVLTIDKQTRSSRNIRQTLGANEKEEGVFFFYQNVMSNVDKQIGLRK